VLALLKTLFDIIRLKKGPDAIPYSWLITLVSLMLWLAAGFTIAAITVEMSDQEFLVGTFTGVVGLACYAAIVVLSGHPPRLLQTVTAILGCGALLSFLFVAGTLVLTPLLSANMTNLVMTLILLWSIPVEGHIIARAIDRHWYVGIVAAMAVFVFQLFLYAYLNATIETVA
jgi:uncharacterized protein with PQ loop repeat